MLIPLHCTGVDGISPLVVFLSVLAAVGGREHRSSFQFPERINVLRLGKVHLAAAQLQNKERKLEGRRKSPLEGAERGKRTQQAQPSISSCRRRLWRLGPKRVRWLGGSREEALARADHCAASRGRLDTSWTPDAAGGRWSHDLSCFFPSQSKPFMEVLKCWTAAAIIHLRCHFLPSTSCQWCHNAKGRSYLVEGGTTAPPGCLKRHLGRVEGAHPLQPTAKISDWFLPGLQYGCVSQPRKQSK